MVDVHIHTYMNTTVIQWKILLFVDGERGGGGPLVCKAVVKLNSGTKTQCVYTGGVLV